MKATSYELRQRPIRADHCDTPSTVTGVTVVPERRKMPQNLVNSGFEYCDRERGDKTDTLASAGVICVNQYGHCVLTKKDVGNIGIKIKRGILKELIAHCAELQKQQRQQDKMDAWHLKLKGPEPLEKEMEAFDSINQSVMQCLGFSKAP